MNIKQKLSKIKTLLYFNAVLKSGKISKVAQENGIKQANLSHLLTDFENATGITLLQRSNQGVTPTNQGLFIAKIADKIEKNIQEIEKILTPISKAQINFYLSPELELKNLTEFENQHPTYQILSVSSPKAADIAILTQEPSWPCEYTTFTTRGNISQKLWLICRMDKPQAASLYDFIMKQLLS